MLTAPSVTKMPFVGCAHDVSSTSNPRVSPCAPVSEGDGQDGPGTPATAGLPSRPSTGRASAESPAVPFTPAPGSTLPSPG